MPEQDGHAEHEPRRYGERGHVAQERLGWRLRRGGKREEEGRDADGQGRRERELARQEREGAASDADREDEQRGEHGLRDEQLGHALDVAQDLAPLLDREGDRLEALGHEHDVGDALRELAARAECDGDIALLEGGDVVDAVADHPDAPASASQRCHELALVLGLHAREDGVVDRAASQRARLLWELRPGRHAPVRVDARGARDCRHRRRPVARDDLDVHARAV